MEPYFRSGATSFSVGLWKPIFIYIAQSKTFDSWFTPNALPEIKVVQKHCSQSLRASIDIL